MTTKKLTGILSLFLCIICLVSCNDNDDNFSPITLEYEDPQIKFDNESRSYTLTPFSKETTPLFIKGGDGTYKVTNENEKVVQVQRKFNIEGKGNRTRIHQDRRQFE